MTEMNKREEREIVHVTVFGESLRSMVRFISIAEF